MWYSSPLPNSFRLAASLALSAIFIMACGDEEVVPDDSPVKESPTPATTPSQIPDDRLIAELKEVSLPPEVKTLGTEPSTFSGQATTGFHTKMSADEIVSYFEQSLPEKDWVAEGEPRAESSEGIDAFDWIAWSFVRGDIRLMVIVNKMEKDMEPGEIAVALITEPVWYPGFNTDGIPAPSIDSTPIPF